MCLITYTPDKNLLDLEVLEGAMENNPHGFGLVFPKDGELWYCRKMEGFEYFKRVIEQKVPRETPLGIHFRWATHGEKVVANVHPYPILSKKAGHKMDLCFMHNGVISGVHTYKDEESDTRLYLKHILQPLLIKYPEMVFDPAFKLLVERDIGGGSKLLFMAGDGRHIIYNEEKGSRPKEEPKIWYSNEYSFKKNYRTPTTHYRTTTTRSTEPGVDFENWKKRNEGNGITGSMPEAGTYELNLPAYLSAYVGKDEYLMKQRDAYEGIFGFGWIFKNNILYHNKTVALAQKRWYAEREKETTATPAVTKDIAPHHIKTPPGPKLDNVVELARQVSQMEKNLSTSDFRTMSLPETYDWVLHYPDEAASWLSKNGWFASQKQLRTMLENNPEFIEMAADYIDKRVKQNNYVMPLDDMNKILEAKTG